MIEMFEFHDSALFSKHAVRHFDDHAQVNVALCRIIDRHTFCSGWTLLIAPPQTPDKNALKAANINLDKVLVVNKKPNDDALFSAYRAIKSGTCSSIVIWDDLISELEFELLENAARKSGTSLYLLRNTGHTLNQVSH